nr:CPBP family intramembrane glutamic endopeptidase [Qipengyuania sphaerica]
MLAGGHAADFLGTWGTPSAYGLLALNIFVVALLEEIGWRGYLTPCLLRRMSPFVVSLVVGLVWALWHGPKLFSLPMLGVVAIALSFTMTFLVATRKAGLIGCIMLHGSFNAAVMALENAVEFETALTTFNIMAGGMVLLAIALVALRREWFFGKPASQETARPASP